MSKPEVPPRKRKPAARPTAVVVGAITERISMLPNTDELVPHRDRLTDLLDELRRSISKKEEPEE